MMCERSGDGDASPDLHPARMSRRSGVTLPQPAPDTSPRRSSIIKDPAVHKVGGGRKKTVSFSSMPSEKKVSSVTDCLAFMQCGCELKKVRPNSRVYCRFYTLDPDLSCLRWEPSKKDSDRARLDIVTMREVCTGKSTDTFRHHGSVEHLAEEAAFSIVHGEGHQTLDLVALSPDVANIWVTGLRYLISHPSHCSGAPKGSLGSRLRRDWLAAQFAESDEGGCGVMPEDVAVATICKLCPGIKESKVRLRFKEIQRSKEKLTSHVTLEEFQEAYCELCTRPDVYFLLVQLTQDRECLDAQDLRVFLETEQGLPQVSSESCLHIVHRFEPSLQGRNQGLLGLDGFMRYLQSPECQLSEPEQQNVCQDMNLPLCHYYISTSYRSYLVEDQVLGQADFGGLLRAMQAGCRCLELGVTDGPENEPVLGVGFSPGAGNGHRISTKPITARGALEVINKYAFLTSQYPLLLYLCQHCSPCQQQVLAQHLSRVFGDRLYIPNASDSVTLLSPEQLKGRILLVGKRLPPQVDVSEGEVSEEEEEGALGLMKRQGSSPEAELSVEGSPVKPCRLRLRKELSELLVLSHSGSHAFHSCHHSPEHSPSSTLDPQGTALWTLCSLSETEAARLASESPEELVGFTKGTLTRVRPSAARLDSSNPNPLDFWKGGCQLVALNQQTPGVMLDLYRARFSQNGGCGYVLKPSLMREEVSYFSAQTQGCVPGVPPQTLRVKVISANGLPKPQGSGAKGEVIDPYVVLELHGVPADCTEFRTRTAAQNQDNPLFDETFEFQVNMPELAILRFVVLDDDYIGDDFIGQYSIPFECLQPGYRTVPLLDLLGEPLPHGSLFIHLAVTNRSGGGKAHKRGLSVRRGARQEQDSVTLRSINIKALDDSFRAANAPLKEATDLRVNAQNATVSFKEHCGLPSVATLKQCVQSLATRLQTPDGPSGVGLVLREGYPCLEGLGNLSEATRRVLSAFDAMISAQRQLIENADAYMERITQVQKEAECNLEGLLVIGGWMEYHEDLRRFGEKEGLKGRKHSKAVESFAWNITVLKGQRDLLRSAKADALDVLRQLTLSAEVCGLTTDNTKTD